MENFGSKQVLVTSGNQLPLASGNRIEDLAIGQIGVFDPSTGLSIDGTENVNDFYLAVGIADGVFKTSIGTSIASNDVNAYTFRAHTPSRPDKIRLSGFVSECNTTYSLKVQKTSSSSVATIGYRTFYDYFDITTGTCTTCASCYNGDANEIVKLFVEKINLKDRKLIARAITPVALTILTHGVAADLAIDATVPLTDFDAILAYNKANPGTAVTMVLEIESVPLSATTNFYPGFTYFKNKQVTLDIVLGEGFENVGTITKFQKAVQEEGFGADIAALEYQANVNNKMGGAYLISSINHVNLTSDFVTTVDKAGFYNTFVIMSTPKHYSGFRTYESNTVVNYICIPAADTVTAENLVITLNNYISLKNLNFDQLFNDVSGAIANPATIETTSSKTDTTDGLS